MCTNDRYAGAASASAAVESHAISDAEEMNIGLGDSAAHVAYRCSPSLR